MSRDLAQGALRPTDRQLDFAIVGTGYFRIRLEDGSQAYTRDGVFALDGDNRLVTLSGDFVEPGLDLPVDFSEMRISADGTVTVVRPQTQDELDALPPEAPRDGIRVEVGRIGLTRFVNPGGLESIGENLFQATEASQEPIDGFPGRGRTRRGAQRMAGGLQRGHRHGDDLAGARAARLPAQHRGVPDARTDADGREPAHVAVRDRELHTR